MESHLPEYIQCIIKIAPCAMAVVDTTLCYVAVSEKWAEQFGIEEDLTGKPHNAFFPGTGGQPAVIYQDGLQGKISRAEENKVFPDGSMQYLKWEVQPWYNGKNEIGGLVIYANDLTAVRIREEVLEKSLDRYEQINKMTRVGVWEIDVRTGKIYWSAVIRQILGVPEDYEPTRESTAGFFSAGTDMESSLKHYNAALEKGIPYNLELELVTAGGKRLWVRARGDAEFRDGKCVRIYGSLQDIQSEREQRAQLLNSEIKYRSTIENSLYGVLLTIPGHHVIEANQAALSMFGYNLEELRKVERDQIFDVNDLALEDFMDRRARDGRARAEVTGIRKNGEHFPCEISAAMFDDIEGKKLNSLVIIDISERRLAEEKIRLSQEQFREAFEFSAIGMALFGLDGRWKRVNQQLCDMLGYTEEELMQLRFQDITHPDDVDRNLDLLRNLVEGNGNGYQLEKRYIHKNGCVIWVLLGVSLIRDIHHQPVHCISQIQDITKTKEAEYALAVSEEKYRKIFENIQDIYYRTDVNGIITEISPSVEKYYNYKRKDIIGSPVTDFYYYKEDQEKIMEALKADHAVTDFEVKLRSNTSELLYASVNSRLVFENGMITGTEGIIRDISIRKLQENELTSLNTELTALNKHKEKLLSIIGHDLRNPIANTLKLAELALMDTNDVTKEELVEYLTKMSTGLTNANELLEDLLYWAKSQFDSLAFNPVAITDIKVQIDACLKKIMPMAETKQITVHTTVKPGIAIIADKDMLDAIIRNLVSNAIKFTGNGGSVMVSAEDRKKDVKFAVTDTGSGMSEKITLQLFNKGFSHTTYGTSGEKGTGLGLDLCRDFVEIHQGRIWVESTEGQGSAFYFTLPRPEESPVV